MIAHRRTLIIAAAAFLLVDLALTFLWGGWVARERLDPLLALPSRMVALLVPLAVARLQGERTRWLAYGLAILAAAGLHLLLMSALAVRVAWLQLLVPVGISLVWMLILDQGYRAMGKASGFARVAGWAGLILAPLLAAVIATFALQQAYAAPRSGQRVTMITGLPLVWGEGGGDITSVLSGDGAPDPAMRALEARFAMTTIDTITTETLPTGTPLLVVHPKALAPAELVALDTWVRDGGRALILADAFLAWEPSFPLGDTRNPPITSLLTPLLDHWGLDLILPAKGEPIVVRQEAGYKLRFAAPGVFAFQGRKGIRCRISQGGIVADCSVDKGRAILVADADLLDQAQWLASGSGEGDASISPALWRSDNIGWIADMLGALGGGQPQRARAQPVWIQPAT